MYWKTTFAAIALGSIISGCGSASDRQWMKINEKYSTADFRRDHATCSVRNIASGSVQCSAAFSRRPCCLVPDQGPPPPSAVRIEQEHRRGTGGGPDQETSSIHGWTSLVARTISQEECRIAGTCAAAGCADTLMSRTAIRLRLTTERTDNGARKRSNR